MSRSLLLDPSLEVENPLFNMIHGVPSVAEASKCVYNEERRFSRLSQDSEHARLRNPMHSRAADDHQLSRNEGSMFAEKAALKKRAIQDNSSEIAIRADRATLQGRGQPNDAAATSMSVSSPVVEPAITSFVSLLSLDQIHPGLGTRHRGFVARPSYCRYGYSCAGRKRTCRQPVAEIAVRSRREICLT